MRQLTWTQKCKRAEIANAIIDIIASHGRRFFSLSADRPGAVDRVSFFWVAANGKVWFFDKYTQAHIYLHYPGKWHGFTEGGTLRAVVEMLRDFISGKRKEVDLRYFGPWEQWRCGGDPWAYGPDMEKVRTGIKAVMEQFARLNA